MSIRPEATIISTSVNPARPVANLRSISISNPFPQLSPAIAQPDALAHGLTALPCPPNASSTFSRRKTRMGESRSKTQEDFAIAETAHDSEADFLASRASYDDVQLCSVGT